MKEKEGYIGKGALRVIRRTIMPVFSLLVLSFLGLAAMPQRSYACPDCDGVIQNIDPHIWQEAEDEFNAKLDAEFKRLERNLMTWIWEQTLLPMMMLAAEQFTAVALQQALAIGMFIDAENQMAAQRLLQEMQAKAHKDYHPSEGMCVFGSVMKGIAESERKGEITAIVLSQRAQDRQLGNANSAGTYGNDLDKANRIDHFKKLFCNEKNRSNAMASICTSLTWNASLTPESRERLDKDIDYFSLMDAPRNLKIDFTNQIILDMSATPQIRNEDEEHVFAMASNLFAHDIFPRPPVKLLKNSPVSNALPDEALTNMRRAYIDARSIIAKRSVAENSFNAIAALKSEGHMVTPPAGPPDVPMSSRIYMESILTELGMPAAEVLNVLGERPSYYAQMEILTKKIYQSPNFYTNLYDKPVNVERKTVALQAIKLMQKFDMLKSFLRNEMATSVLLELEVSNLQDEIEDEIQSISVMKE